MTVRVFRSTDSGSPGGFANTVGELCTILDAILVAGYPLKTITAMARSSGVVTCDCTAHGFTSATVHTISGADQDEYNGNHTITVTDANHFTFPIATTPTTPATGTLRASDTTTALGWKKAFTGTNKRAYQLRGGTGFLLRVDHSVNAYDARIRGYEAMSDIDTGTGPFPTVAQMANGVFIKMTNNAGPRSWMLVGDELGFVLRSNTTGAAADTVVTFGDFKSFKPSDAFNCLIAGSDTDNAGPDGNKLSVTAVSSFLTSVQGGQYLARAHTQTGSAITFGKSIDTWRHGAWLSGGAATPNTDTLTYPCPIDGGLHLSRLIVVEPGVGMRGLLRGLYWICHERTAMAGVAHNDTVNGSDVLASKTFQIFETYGGSTSINARMAVETSDTWETP
jgi:hypothetical protein